METALHSLISRVKKSMHVKEYTLAIFLDIEGAFNNVDPDAIAKALGSLVNSPGLVLSSRNPLRLNWVLPRSSCWPRLAIERKFFRDANLSWANEESCSTVTHLALDA